MEVFFRFLNRPSTWYCPDFSLIISHVSIMIFYWKSERNSFEQLSNFIILHCNSSRIFGLEAFQSFVDKVQCMTNGRKFLCWWSTWQGFSTTTDFIFKFCWRVMLVVCANSTHKIISVFSSCVGEISKWIFILLLEYFSII